MKRIDTHQHLAFKDRFEYPWMAQLPPLNEDRYYLEDYGKAADGCQIEGTVFMENDVREDLAIEEAKHVCRLAEDPANRILGVIASARPEKSGFAQYLENIRHPKLSGVRRILHTEPDQLSEGALFRENLNVLGQAGLSFDLCVLQKQLPFALDLVRACPNTTFVLDHCGVPEISANAAPAGEGFRIWKGLLTKLADLPNVYCKVSGIIAYATEDQRTADGLRPYVESVIEIFGWDRVVWGGDWPVCNLGASLAEWCRLLDEILSGESDDQKRRLFSENARRLYNLE